MNVTFYHNVAQNDVNSILSNYGKMALDNYGEAEYISPGKKSKSGLSLTEIYGNGEFPFHTDVAYWPEPANYLALYCVNPGSGNRKTKVIDCENLMNEIKSIFLGDDLFLVKKRITPFYCRVLNGTNKNRWLRWDQNIMEPIGNQSVVERISGLIGRQKSIDVDWIQGLLVVINNKLCLHSRGVSETNDSDRLIRRVLIKG